MTNPDTTNALDVIEEALKDLSRMPTADEGQRTLIGTESQIKIWKPMFGNGVNYVIGNKIKGEG